MQLLSATPVVPEVTGADDVLLDIDDVVAVDDVDEAAAVDVVP